MGSRREGAWESPSVESRSGWLKRHAQGGRALRSGVAREVKRLLHRGQVKEAFMRVVADWTEETGMAVMFAQGDLAGLKRIMAGAVAKPKWLKTKSNAGTQYVLWKDAVKELGKKYIDENKGQKVTVKLGRRKVEVVGDEWGRPFAKDVDLTMLGGEGTIQAFHPKKGVSTLADNAGIDYLNRKLKEVGMNEVVTHSAANLYKNADPMKMPQLAYELTDSGRVLKYYLTHKEQVQAFFWRHNQEPSPNWKWGKGWDRAASVTALPEPRTITRVRQGGVGKAGTSNISEIGPPRKAGPPRARSLKSSPPSLGLHSQSGSVSVELFIRPVLWIKELITKPHEILTKHLFPSRRFRSNPSFKPGSGKTQFEMGWSGKRNTFVGNQIHQINRALFKKSQEVMQLKRITRKAQKSGNKNIVGLERRLAKEEINLSRLKLAVKDQKRVDDILNEQKAVKHEIKSLKNELSQARKAKDTHAVKSLETKIEKESLKLASQKAKLRGLAPTPLALDDLYKMQVGKKILERAPGTQGVYRMKLEPARLARPEKFNIKGKTWVGKSWTEGKIRGYEDHGVFARYDLANQEAANKADAVIARFEPKAISAMEVDLRKAIPKPAEFKMKSDVLVPRVSVDRNFPTPKGYIIKKARGGEHYFHQSGVPLAADEDVMFMAFRKLPGEVKFHPQYRYTTDLEKRVLEFRNQSFKDYAIGGGPISSHASLANVRGPLPDNFRLRLSFPGDRYVYLADTKAGVSELLKLTGERGYFAQIPKSWRIFQGQSVPKNVRLLNWDELGKK